MESAPVESQSSRPHYTPIRDFCKQKYLCKIKSCGFYLIVLDLLLILLKCAYVLCRRYKVNSVADICAYIYAACTIPPCLVFGWFGLLKERVWAFWVYFVTQAIHIIVTVSFHILLIVLCSLYYEPDSGFKLQFSIPLRGPRFDGNTLTHVIMTLLFLLTLFLCAHGYTMHYAYGLGLTIRHKLRGGAIPEDDESCRWGFTRGMNLGEA